MNLGKHPCVIVAHPDDETLWAGGLILKNPHLEWTVVCCSIPRRDPERAWLWHDACRRLGVRYTRLMPVQEAEPGQPLAEIPVMRNYSSYITHGKAGEYGHLQHMHVHEAVTMSADAPVYGFSLKKPEFKIVLSNAMYKQKLRALQAYSHKPHYHYSPGLSKWEALLHRYGEMEGINFQEEGFDLC